MTMKRPMLYGALKGTVTIAPGVDLTEPTREIWQAMRTTQRLSQART
jgi:hypothetical protein